MAKIGMTNLNKLIEKIDDKCNYIVDRISKPVETNKMVCDRDYQRDTYYMIKELKFKYEQDKIDNELKELKKEQDLLNWKIKDLEFSKNRNEFNYIEN